MRRFIIAAAVAVAGFVGTAAPAHAAAITFNSTTVSVGQTFTVDVMLTGSNPGIAAFGFDFVFNSAVLQLTGISEGNIFGGLGSFNASGTSASGEVDSSLYPWESSLTPATLARLTFTAIGAGAAGLQLTNTHLTGVNWVWIIPVPYSVEHTVTNGTINAGTQPIPTPEPGTMTLFGLGAYALARRIRRKNAADVAVA